MFFKRLFHKYKITIDTGLFDIETNPEYEARERKKVIIKRTSEIPSDMTMPEVIIINKDNTRSHATQEIYSTNASLWYFIMPACDVKLVPIIHRKHKHNI